jgi:hypothetical protein
MDEEIIEHVCGAAEELDRDTVRTVLGVLRSLGYAVTPPAARDADRDAATLNMANDMLHGRDQ